MLRSRVAAAIALAATLGLAQPARADLVLGDFLGFGNAENDSVAAILADFGLIVTFLARIEPPENSDPVSGSAVDGLTYFNFVLNDDGEPAGGEWSYTDPLAQGRTAHLLALKAGPNWGLWQFTDENTNGMPNMGLFNTLQLQPGNDPGDQRGFGDVTVYQLEGVVPEPPALALVGAGLVGLRVLGRRRTG